MPLITDEVEYETVSAYGSASAPTINTALGTIVSGSLPAGMYKLEVTACFSAGTPAAAEDGNFTVRKQTTVLGRLTTSRNTTTIFFANYTVRVNGSESLNVINATSAATAGVVYTVTLRATKIGD